MKIQYDGFFQDQSGYGEAARRMVDALRLVQADVRPGHVLTDGHGSTETEWDQEFLALEPHERPDVQITHAFARDFPTIPRNAPIRIGATCWETDRLPQAYIDGAKAVDYVTVPSRQNMELFCEEGIPVSRVPYPILCAPETEMTRIPALDALESPHVFFSVGTWQPRKNFHGLVTAFLTSSLPSTSVLALVIGGTALNVKMAKNELGYLIAALNLPEPRPTIVLLHGLSRGQLAWLNTQALAYVTMSRGEGFAFPLADACAQGRAIMAPDWGGHMDFLCQSNGPRCGVSLVPTHLTPVVQHYPLFHGLMNWSDPSVILARSSLEAMADAPPQVYVRDLSDFTFRAVGQEFVELLSAACAGALVRHDGD